MSKKLTDYQKFKNDMKRLENIKTFKKSKNYGDLSKALKELGKKINEDTN